VRSVLLAVVVVACGHREPDARESPPVDPRKPRPTAARPSPPPAPTPPPAPPAPDPREPTRAEVADGPPPDGKYERVTVEGKTVAMVHILSGGAVVLVDVDGGKPRTWEEQYKRKDAKLAGQLDVHKTDANHNGSFEDDPIDRRGLWVIDAKGNILAR
jgi:hypothetical protein